MDTKHFWDITEYAERAAGLNHPRPPVSLLEEHLLKVPRVWQEKEVIERDTRINGGVYLFSKDGKTLREALVVDDERSPELKAIHDEVRKRMVQESIKRGVPQKNLAFSVISGVLNEVMPYFDGVIEATEALTDKFVGQEMDIGENIRNHAGVCRHKALIGAYVMERLIDEGVLKGRVSVDRSCDPVTKKGHAWIRYTSASEEVFIFDPAKDFIGTLRQGMAEGGWDYRRPTDKIKGFALPRMLWWSRAVKID